MGLGMKDSNQRDELLNSVSSTDCIASVYGDVTWKKNEWDREVRENILHNLKQWIHLSFSSFGLGRISFIALTALFITLRMCCGTWLLTCNILIIFCWNEKKLKKRFVHFDELHSKIRVSKRIRTSHHYMIGTPRSSRTTLHWKWMTSDLLLVVCLR